MNLHPGIRIHSIPVSGVPGAIFTIGMLTVFLIGVPETRQFLSVSLPLGALIGLALRWSDRAS